MRACSPALAMPSVPTTPRSSCSRRTAAPRCARAWARTASASRWSPSTPAPPRRCAPSPPNARSRSTRRSPENSNHWSRAASCATSWPPSCAARIASSARSCSRTGSGSAAASTPTTSRCSTVATNAGAALQFDRLEHAVAELREVQERLDHQAHHDPLTGLANRALFIDRVSAALNGPAARRSCSSTSTTSRPSTTRSARRSATSCCVRPAHRLVRAVRGEDLVARLGGDEFAILVRRRRDDVDAEATELAERAAQLRAAGRRRRPAVRRQLRSASPPASTRRQHRRPAARRRHRDVRGQVRRQEPLPFFTPAMREAVSAGT